MVEYWSPGQVLTEAASKGYLVDADRDTGRLHGQGSDSNGRMQAVSITMRPFVSSGGCRDWFDMRFAKLTITRRARSQNVSGANARHAGRACPNQHS
jgi:hypothetical protein